MSDVIHTLLERESVLFGPEDIAKLVAGFESALTNLGLKERSDPGDDSGRQANHAALVARLGEF
jgi:hypothetical protein